MNLGMTRAIYQRALSYWALVSQLMIVSVFIKTVGWKWWYLLIIPIALVGMYFDIKRIWPQEAEYGFTRSKSFKEVVNRLRSMEDKIDKMSDIL